MFKVKIYGAGSIGNHLANGCRNQGWDVLICDNDPKALERTRSEIYPSRYGKWDEKIQLCTPDKAPKSKYDLVVIGTPPDSHMRIAANVIHNDSPRAILIEKPLATPSLNGCQQLIEMANDAGVALLVGYNHAIAKNTVMAQEAVKAGTIGEPLGISVRWLEYWGGIFSAHPWLDGPKDSYLGFFRRGGGACGEHSHAINIWQHFAHLLEQGRIIEVSAMMDMVKKNGVEYDSIAQLSVRTEKGLAGSIIQDVITEPSVKTLRVQGDKGYLEWFANFAKGQDAILYGDGKSAPRQEIVNKTRPDDFKWEIEHVGDILSGKADARTSPISVSRGMDTMLVIAAAYRSSQIKRTVFIDHSAGYCTDAIWS